MTVKSLEPDGCDTLVTSNLSTRIFMYPVYHRTHENATDRSKQNEISQNFFNCFSDIPVNANRSVGNFVGTEHLAAIDAGVGRAGIFRGHLPKGILDDDRRVIPDTEFEKQYLLSLTGAQEVCIPPRRRVPALVLDKPVVRAKIHGQGLSAVRTARDERRRNFHVLLLCDHLPDNRFIVPCLLTARLTALKQPVVALRVKQPLFVEACLLKAVVNIRRDDKIVLVLYKTKQFFIDPASACPYSD